MAEPVAPIVLRFPTAADPAVLRAALTIPEGDASRFTATRPLDAVGGPYTLDLGDGSVVDPLAGEA